MKSTNVPSRTASALARYADAHRARLEVAIESYETYGDRNYLTRAPVTAEHDAAYEAIPWWLRWTVCRIERRVARDMDFRNRASR